MVIIILIAPWVLPLLGLGALFGAGGVGMFFLEHPVMVTLIGGVVAAVWAYDYYQKSKTFICMKCGKKFKEGA